jgi:hypothetical protein
MFRRQVDDKTDLEYRAGQEQEEAGGADDGAEQRQEAKPEKRPAAADEEAAFPEEDDEEEEAGGEDGDGRHGGANQDFVQPEVRDSSLIRVNLGEGQGGEGTPLG